MLKLGDIIHVPRCALQMFPSNDMRKTILLATIAMWSLVSPCCAQQACGRSSCGYEQNRAGQPIEVYALYSWRDEKSQNWEFSILEGFSNHAKTSAEVFNEKTTLHGLDQLKQAVAKLPIASALWVDPNVFGNVTKEVKKQLKYPPADVIQEVKNIASARQVKVMFYNDHY